MKLVSGQVDVKGDYTTMDLVGNYYLEYPGPRWYKYVIDLDHWFLWVYEDCRWVIYRAEEPKPWPEDIKLVDDILFECHELRIYNKIVNNPDLLSIRYNDV